MEEQSLKVKNILFFVVLALILGTIPYLIAWGLTDNAHQFFGAIVNVDDFKAYLSAIQQGRQGYWLFHYNFTPEQYEPQLMYPLYILIGKLAGILGGKNIVWLHISRLAFGLFTFLAFRFWVQSMFPKSKSLQLSAWLLISFGSGFGLFIVLINWDPVNLPLDLIVPELNTITNLISSPHYILAVGLLAVYFGSLQLFSTEESSSKWALIATLAGLGIGLIYPYQIPMIGLTTGLWLITIALRQKRIPWKKWAQGAVVLAPLTIMLVYYALVARQDALWELTFVANHGRPSPSPWKLFLAFGFLAVFAAASIFRQVRVLKSSTFLLPIIWAAVNLFVLYLPFPFALRLVLGLHIPIGSLAAIFVEETILPGLKKFNISRGVILFATVPTTLLFVSFVSTIAAGENNYPYYYLESEITAVDWLAAQLEEDDLILANYHLGGYIPTVMNAKVFMGQFAITIDYRDKIALAQKFWEADTPQSWREDFVKEWGITHIIQAAAEASDSGERIVLPYEVIFQQNGVTIYSIE